MYKVLHIVKALGLGGTEKVMQLMALGLRGSRFEPAVFSLQDGARAAMLQDGGIDVKISDRLFEYILEQRPHIVHVHRAGWPEPGLMRPIAAARLRLARQTGSSFKLLETNVFGRHDPSPEGKTFDTTLFVSHFCAQRFARLHQLPAEPPRRQVLYNPIDYATISAQTLPPAQRDYSRPVAGRVSRPDPGKWSNLALDWLPSVCAEIPGFRYKIIGGIEPAVQFVQKHRLEQQVEFLPAFLNDSALAGFLDGLSVFAHANDTGESFGLVIAEAMAAGLPVITHPAAGERDNAQLELVEHGKTGLIAGNAEEYAAAVIWLLNHPAEARRMGAAGREKAAREYAQEVIAAKLIKIYEDLLKE
ncbi:MAG: glycosyltransferase family 4 protein [Desulfovibrionaceae bacterium]|nr:glycosyltransferase family 4 protein [Desulfovibrionaceae bacterium]